MRKTMVLTLAAASLAAGPALATPPQLCSGDACAVVTAFLTDGTGCKAFRNTGDHWVGGVVTQRVSTAQEETVFFAMAPGATSAPHLKSGECYREVRPYRMQYQAEPKPKGGKKR